MRSHVRLALVILFCLAATAPVAAQGIIVEPPSPEVRPILGGPIRIAIHRVTVEVEDQIATTRVEQVFVNESSAAVEGTYLFPLPADAAISDFAMWVDGKRLEGKLLSREQARAIYEAIVRQQRDPALLEYVGRELFQASIFPIPPGGQRKIELSYSQVLARDGTLIHYRYPMRTDRLAPKPVGQMSISISLRTAQPLKAIYSPTHDVAIVRDGDRRARVGFEDAEVYADRDFDLYFSTAAREIDLSVLSYRPGGEDGFFLLLAAPPVAVDAQEIVAKDVILVLDTSGSMKGEKIRQAQDALLYVLGQLQAEDRFNVVAFSTGVRSFTPELQPAAKAADAREWVKDLRAVGGTDINRALLEALASLPRDGERPAILIFLTDGLPTEGETRQERILANAAEAAGRHVRLFTFGVGDDVDTVLLDQLAQEHRGSSAYVRPGQRIDEIVSAFYARVSQPILTDLVLRLGDLQVEDVYPYPLPDLFAGSQLVVTGRYRKGGIVDIKLEGMINDRAVSYVYDDVLVREEGGEPFIARLWATRKIGYLLTQIRLHGAQRELIDEVVDLSQRYNIVTPYTSYLVEEPGVTAQVPDIRTTVVPVQPIPRPSSWLGRLLGTGGGAAAPAAPAAAPTGEAKSAPAYEPRVVIRDLASAPVSGAEAVEESQAREALRSAERAAGEGGTTRVVGSKTFLWQEGVWVDRAYDATKMKPERVTFGSDVYFRLMAEKPALAPYFALGTRVIVVLDGTVYEIVEG